jgi:hypothetical protein
MAQHDLIEWTGRMLKQPWTAHMMVLKPSQKATMDAGDHDATLR